MKASELRIGNWVKTCIPDMDIMIPTLVTQVQGIDIFGRPLFCHSTGVNGFHMHINHVQPIQLTPEILEKCGFEKRIINNAFNEYFLPCTPAGYKNEWILRYMDYDNNPGLEFAPRLDGSIHSFPCNSLHQLQNLFYALTGEELNYQP